MHEKEAFGREYLSESADLARRYNHLQVPLYGRMQSERKPRSDPARVTDTLIRKEGRPDKRASKYARRSRKRRIANALRSPQSHSHSVRPSERSAAVHIEDLSSETLSLLSNH
jgi:hypothetical protein